MADITVSPDRPGLWVQLSPPVAVFACACGFVRRATGQRGTREVVDQHRQHNAHCPRRSGAGTARPTTPAAHAA